MKKIIIIANNTKAFLNFRADLSRDFIKHGYKVIAIVPQNTDNEKFKEIGIKQVIVDLDRHSLSLTKNLKLIKDFESIIKEEKPDIVFSYTIKPIIFGSIAAHKCKIKKIYSMLSGIGPVYEESKSIGKKAVKAICGLMYKKAFKLNNKVFFQNIDDLNEFVKLKYLPKEKSILVNGSGINMSQFKKYELPKENVFLMVARPTKSKGVLDYFAAAKIVKEKHPDVRFIYIGGTNEQGNGAVTKEEIKTYAKSNIIEYIEKTDDIYGCLKHSRFFCLPSYYREGVPHSILEALSVGRPIITLNTPGCRETINGKNGLFAKKQNPKDLARQMNYLIEHPKEAEKMAEESYKFCKEKFDVKTINKVMLSAMEIK